MATKVISVTSSGKQKLIDLDSFTPQWAKETFTVNASSTISSLDINGDANFVKYIFLAQRISGGTNNYAFEMNVHDVGGSTLDTISNIIGNMSLVIESVVDVNGIHIDITNNEAYNIDVTLTYMSN